MTESSFCSSIRFRSKPAELSKVEYNSRSAGVAAAAVEETGLGSAADEAKFKLQIKTE